RRHIGHRDLQDRRDPGRPVAQCFDLLVLDEDRVGAEPIVAANRAIDDLRVPDAAPVGLGVRHERRLLPVLELDLEHAYEGSLRGAVIRERVIREGPGVPLAPEAVQEGIDVLDEWIAVELRCEERIQLPKSLLEKRMVVARLGIESGLPRSLASAPFPLAL